MSSKTRWIDQVSKEDLDFLKDFILTSGSLKEMAKKYGISYPTIRLRLDRLIETVKTYSTQESLSPMEMELQLLVVRGEISRSAAEKLLRAHNETVNEE